MNWIKKLKLSHLEIAIAVLAFFAVWVLLARYALGGPLSNDSIAYMNAGLNHVEITYILNRYFHVFLMALFMKLASTPLVGFQSYWAFLLAATALLVYYNARTFTSRSNFIHGILAVGIFFSFRFFGLNTGMAGVDMTAMFMVMVFITVFLISTRNQYQSKWILMGLGFLFFLAFKTKETTLVAGLLFIGLGFQDGRFQFKAFGSRLGYVALGLLGGVVFFALLNWIILGDPLFGWRISNIREFLSTYVPNTVGKSQREGISSNWYTAYLLQAIYIPFIFYLISGIRVSPELDLGRRLVWWIPPALVCFISLSSSIAWGPRFLLAAFPIISLLGPQFLELEIPADNRDRIKLGLRFAAALAVLLVVYLALHFLVPRTQWTTDILYVMIYEPAILSIILALTFLLKRFSTSVSVITTVLIIAITISPVVNNTKVMLTGQNRVVSNKVFYPYSAFSDEIKYSPDMEMLVSLDAWNALDASIYCKNIDGVVDLFNIYFDANSTRSNFTVASAPISLTQITDASDAYVLLSKSDWQALPEESRSTLQDQYSLVTDKKGLLVLLERK